MKIGYFVDWLEIYCIEWKDVDIKDRLESKGYRVEIMPYTTRVYGQVLQVYKGKSEPYFTICRLPLSVRSNDSSGILKAGSCHIKLHNHLCYVENVGAVAMQCCKDAGVTIQNISRIDLCADFQYFYNGMHPSTLIKGFASEKYLKIGQPRFTLHGTTEKGYNYYNSVLFGSKTSSVYTRFYEKSLEMKEVAQKDWIVDCWRELEFDLDDKQVWRVEFAVHGPGRKMLDRKTAEVQEITVQDLCSRDKIKALFISLAKRYFVFTKADTATRKYNQEHLVLFDMNPDVEKYSPLPGVRKTITTRTTKQVYEYLIKESESNHIYSFEERMRLWQTARNLATHHNLRQWEQWKHGPGNADMPIEEPVIKPITQVQGNGQDNENVIIEQTELW